MSDQVSTKKRPEIIAPAGNLEKLKFAVLYGADAVYFGGEQHNLRIRSDNFSRDDIAEAVRFCRERGARTVFLMNSFLHEKDIQPARAYLSEIRDFRFDAVMVSDPGMMLLIREAGIESDIHLSTQMSTLNHLAVKFWRDAGVARIVLAREATADEIRAIKEQTGAAVEVFVHGALCIAYSGRCLLSRYLAGRDANRGDCAQACRWRYSLVEEKRPGEPLEIIEHGPCTEILSSKDLCLVGRLDEYIAAGVDALKIEGRMKSIYYTANTVRIYRHAASLAGTAEFANHLPFYREELDLVSHRPYTDDLFNEFGGNGFAPIPTVKKALFLGYKAGTAPGGGSLVKTFNPVYRGETLDAIFPITDGKRDCSFTVKEIFDDEDRGIDMARPYSFCRVIFDREPDDYAIFRRRL
ncbi:MAG: U32 family peptidase [Spirochaetes bacterium]|nr:U32 family peptidase [Spirochaetota bacterium]